LAGVGAALIKSAFPDEHPKRKPGGSLASSSPNLWTILDKFADWILKQFGILVGRSKLRTKTMSAGLVCLVLGVGIVLFSISKSGDDDSGGDDPGAGPSSSPTATPS
jgi:hypothetical protein